MRPPKPTYGLGGLPLPPSGTNLPSVVLITSDLPDKPREPTKINPEVIELDEDSDSDASSEQSGHEEGPKKRGRGRLPKALGVVTHLPRTKKPPQICSRCGGEGKKKDFMRCKICERNLHPHCY